MGTIADKLQHLNGTKQAIKQAIIEKGQPVTDVDTFRSYADKVRAISGGGASGVNDITFYDYDGTIVKSYSIEEFALVTELPVPPEHERLTFQGWNWSIEDIKSAGGKVDVGATYVTKSGKTEFDMTFTEAIGLSITMKFTTPTSGNILTVDWGDGVVENSDSDAGSKTFSHTYSDAGSYTATVDGTGAYSIHGSPISPYNMFDSSPTHQCTEVRIGSRCTTVFSYAFSNCLSLKYITIPKHIPRVWEYTFLACYSLIYVAMPINILSVELNTFQNCYSLKGVSIQRGANAILGSSFQNCFSISSIVIPSGVEAIGNNSFRYCRQLERVTILRVTPPSLAGTAAFLDINGFCIIEVPAESVELYKEATNWNQFANRIKAIGS